MKLTSSTSRVILLTVLSFLLLGCGALSAPASTPTAAAPAVEIGYLASDLYSRLPTAFIDYEPGLTISAVYSPAVEDPTVRHSIYKETITYASGKTVTAEFFVTKASEEGMEYEAVIDGQVTQIPAYKDYLTNLEAKMKDKLAITFWPNNITETLLKLPPLCPDEAELSKKYSPLPKQEWFKSLDSLTLRCPATGKTHTFEFSYTREETGDPLINSFTVKINESAQ